MCVNSRVILVFFCLPAVPEVIDIFCQSAIWFGKVIVWVLIIVTTETTHLVIVGAGGTKTKRIQDKEMKTNVLRFKRQNTDWPWEFWKHCDSNLFTRYHQSGHHQWKIYSQIIKTIGSIYQKQMICMTFELQLAQMPS